MRITLRDTDAGEIARAMVRARHGAGSPAMDMVLTFLVVTDDENVADAMREATTLSHEHPARVIGVVIGHDQGPPTVNAKVRFGESASGESILLRISGELTAHAESVVLPLLLPDSPVVAWWPGPSPSDPGEDPIGSLAQRRLTDCESSDDPVAALLAVARGYRDGDSDLAWTRLTPWRALLAAALDQASGTVTSGRVLSDPGNPAATLLVAWLSSRLRAPIRHDDQGPGTQISHVTLSTDDGDVVLSRLDEASCEFSVPGSAPRVVPLGRRSLAELLAEELRRLDPDDIYAETIRELRSR